MTKILDCIHQGTDCAFSAEGDTVDEVVQMIAAHVKNEHDTEITPDLVAELRAAIREG
jgi:predicted small metal-binding protein